MVKDKANNTKIKKVLRIIFNIIFWCLIGWIALWLVFNGIDKHTAYKLPFFGYRTSVIVSNSMGSVDPSNESYITDDMKQIKKYDVITTKDYKSYEDIQKYDVLTYYANGSLICHRVVDLYEDNGTKYIVTRGDANNINDDPIAYSLVRGKVVGVSRGTGQFVLFLQSGYVWIAIFGSAFFVCLGMFIFDSKKKAKQGAASPSNVSEQQNESPSEEANNEPTSLESEKSQEQQE